MKKLENPKVVLSIRVSKELKKLVLEKKINIENILMLIFKKDLKAVKDV